MQKIIKHLEVLKEYYLLQIKGHTTNSEFSRGYILSCRNHIADIEQMLTRIHDGDFGDDKSEIEYTMF